MPLLLTLVFLALGIACLTVRLHAMKGHVGTHQPRGDANLGALFSKLTDNAKKNYILELQTCASLYSLLKDSFVCFVPLLNFCCWCSIFVVLVLYLLCFSALFFFFRCSIFVFRCSIFLVQVLYLIVRRHREDSHHRVFLTHSTVRPCLLLFNQNQTCCPAR